jgi:hypothetical protein
MQVTNQFFFVEELERTVAFGVDGVSEVAFNSWKYRDDRAALMVVGCIVDLLANDAGHVQRSVRAKVATACLTKALNARLHPEEKLKLPLGQMPVCQSLFFECGQF